MGLIRELLDEVDTVYRTEQIALLKRVDRKLLAKASEMREEGSYPEDILSCLLYVRAKREEKVFAKQQAETRRKLKEERRQLKTDSTPKEKPTTSLGERYKASIEKQGGVSGRKGRKSCLALLKDGHVKRLGSEFREEQEETEEPTSQTKDTTTSEKQAGRTSSSRSSNSHSSTSSHPTEGTAELELSAEELAALEAEVDVDLDERKDADNSMELTEAELERLALEELEGEGHMAESEGEDDNDEEDIELDEEELKALERAAEEQAWIDSEVERIEPKTVTHDEDPDMEMAPCYRLTTATRRREYEAWEDEED